MGDNYMNRYFDSILAGNYDMYDIEGVKINKNKQEIFGSLREAVLVNITNVHQWLLGQIEQEIDYNKVAPLAKMPFPTMWAEWQHETPGEATVNVGLLCLENKNTIEFFHFRNSTDHPRSECSVTGKATLNEDFSVNYVEVFGEEKEFRRQAGEGGDWRDIEQFFASVFVHACVAFSFFNCSNVRVKFSRPSKSEKRRERKGKGTYQPMGFIEIHKNMIRTRCESEPGSGESEIVPHIVRGHFKRYDKNHKLFGSIEGCWFWPAHVRGGDTAKPRDYRVHPPSKTHAQDCIVEEKCKA